VGNAALLAQLHIALPPAAEGVQHPGSTLVFVAIGGTFRGIFEARDSLRPSARQMVAELRNSGFRLAIITGDSAVAAETIARELDITEVFSGLTPADKVRIVRGLQSSKHRVAMIGDGINDAAALASADAGIAIGTGTDVAREAGDVILVRGEPGDVPGALRLARKTQRIMRQNLGWALAYNVLGIPIAAGALFPFFGILLTPAIASAAMAFSSLSVLLNSLRLKAFRI
jgi:Cu+-exporting ATPase